MPTATRLLVLLILSTVGIAALAVSGPYSAPALAQNDIPSGFAVSDDPNIWSRPAEIGNAASVQPQQAAPSALPHSLPDDGRILLQRTSKYSLRRIPDGLSNDPVTHATTEFEQWKVACESRGNDQACFAAAYTRYGDATLKIKFGPASSQDDVPPSAQHASPAAKSEAQDKQHYVIELEGPPDLDVDTGFILIAPHAVGVFPLNANCSKVSCRISAEIDQDLAGFITPGATAPAGFAVIATAQTSTFLWRFSTAGLSEAFAKVKGDATKTLTAHLSQPPASLASEKPSKPVKSATLRKISKQTASPPRMRSGHDAHHRRSAQIEATPTASPTPSGPLKAPDGPAQPRPDQDVGSKSNGKAADTHEHVGPPTKADNEASTRSTAPQIPQSIQHPPPKKKTKIVHVRTSHIAEGHFIPGQR